MSDPFESSTVSLVLTWILTFPILLSAILFGVAFLFSDHDVPQLLTLWVCLCILVFSPIRYIMLQVVLSTAYIVQSGPALISVFLLALYIPIIDSLLFAVGVGLPMLACTLIEGQSHNKRRTFFAAISLPFLCAVGYALFFAVLPWAAWTIRWLSDKDVMRSTNGPATYVYQFIVKPDIPRIGPQLQYATGDDAKEQLQNHVAHVYVSPNNRTGRHLSLSMRSVEKAEETLGKGSEFGQIQESNIPEALQYYKAALREAEQADVAILNERTSGLGDVWREKYIAGLKATIDGLESKSNWTLLRGSTLLHEFSEWYNAHADAIREGN